MTSIEIKTEEDSPRGWRFRVLVEVDQTRRELTVTLSWSDYDHWSHGRIAPERVAQAAVSYLLSRDPENPVDGDFDCAVIRRRFPEVDRELPAML